MQKSSVNKVIIVGNLGQDPEARFTAQGTAVTNLSIATNESWKNQEGQIQDRTEWHRVVIFNEGLVNVVQQYVKKGANVYIEGQLSTRKWKDEATGQDKYSTEIVLQGYNSSLTMLDSRVNNGNANLVSENKSSLPNDKLNQDTSDLDDEIPF